MTFPCLCPNGWPRVFEHAEDGWPITVVRHHDRCSLSSVRVSGAYMPTAVFENRIAEVTGEKSAKGERG